MGTATKKVKERDGFKCRLCGDTDIDILQVHHLTPKSMGGTDIQSNLITICEPCHMFMHCNPKFIMIQKKKWKDRVREGMLLAKQNGKHIGRISIVNNPIRDLKLPDTPYNIK